MEDPVHVHASVCDHVRVIASYDVTLYRDADRDVRAAMSAPGAGGPVKASSLNFPYCPEITKYEKMAKVGQGTFG